MNDERGGRRGGIFGGNTLGSLWVFALVALVLIYQVVDSQRFRTLIVSGIAVLILLGATALGAWALRLQTVPRAVAMIFLVGVVLISSLLPVFFLGTTDRILLLKLGAIGFLSLFPGLLYSQFIAVRAKTLWTEYVLNLHRLKADRYENLPQPPPSSLYRRVGEETRREDANNFYFRSSLQPMGLLAFRAKRTNGQTTARRAACFRSVSAPSCWRSGGPSSCSPSQYRQIRSCAA